MLNFSDSDVVHLLVKANLGAPTRLVKAKYGRNSLTVIADDRYVIRIDLLEREERSRYWGEKCAYEVLRKKGLPAPEVICVNDSKILIPNDYMIMTKISGVPVVEAWGGLSRSEREAIARQAGNFLARMHQITFDRCGHLAEADINGGAATPADYLAEYFERNLDLAWRLGVINDLLLARMVAIFERYVETVAPRRGVLTHWDYHFENILQQDGKLTGVIDFEWALSSDPALDFAIDDQWELMAPGSTPFIWAGYQDVTVVPENFAFRVAVNRMVKYLDFAAESKQNGQEDQCRKELMRMEEAIIEAEHQLS